LDWWTFDAQDGLLLGMPIDVLIGWCVLWGSLPALVLADLPLALVLGLLLGIDVLVMPATAPLIRLGSRWLIGEVVGLLVCALPAQLLARWTRDDRRLGARVVLQVVCFTGLLLGVVPAIALQATGLSGPVTLQRPAWLLSLALQLLAVPMVVGLAAVQEFWRRGGGTPVPLDPPRRLVTSGPYAYLRNPMQVAACGLLLGLAWLLGTPLLVGAAVLDICYGAGLAGWSEDTELARVFGPGWQNYRRAVRPWWPRWRPYVDADRPLARLYLAASCLPCSQLTAWLSRRHPRGLELVAAEDHPSRDLWRMTYSPGDGSPDDEGVAALGRALEHLSLGWALLGWMVRLPLLVSLVQLVVDAVGGGPRLVARRSR
ncbi:MAG TPA: methyltransferase, partial [Chloroflexota bacterium]|nr:methyltransferase [Chloroflexota bacterium]